MNSSYILSIITFIYCACSFLYIATWVYKKPIIGKLATIATYIGFTAHTVGIILRWVESYRMEIGFHAPFSNMYESLVFFSWSIILAYLLIEHRYKNKSIGGVAVPLAFLAIAYASLDPNKAIQPLIPALKSNWLIAHVIVCFLGYAAFAVSFGIAIMYLMKIRDAEGKSRLLNQFPSVKNLDQLVYQTIMHGFLFLTLGIITGAVWANSAWGTYWSWDPKETWSLITWFIYAILIHSRMVRGWRGKRIAFLSIIGFLAVLFTYFGVNYILPGLHSYAQ